MTDFTLEPKRLLRRNGFAFWRSDATGRKVVVDHAIKSRHTANGVLKQACLPKAF